MGNSLGKVEEQETPSSSPDETTSSRSSSIIRGQHSSTSSSSSLLPAPNNNDTDAAADPAAQASVVENDNQNRGSSRKVNEEGSSSSKDSNHVAHDSSKKRKRSPPATTQTDDQTHVKNALSVLMEAARQQAAKKPRKAKTAFDEMMQNAKKPNAFKNSWPPTKLLLERCQSIAHLVKEQGGHQNDDDDDDQSDFSDLFYFLKNGDNVDEAFDDIAYLEEKELGGIIRKGTSEGNKTVLNSVVFDAPTPSAPLGTTNVRTDANNQQEPGKGTYVTEVWGHLDTRLNQRHVLVGLMFVYSDGTEIVYRGNDTTIKGAKVLGHVLQEGEHLVSMETTHFSLPRMLQKVVFHTNQGRILAIGEQAHTPQVPVLRRVKAEDNHVIRGLEWYAEESMVLSLKTQPLDAIRVPPSRTADYSSSLVHLAHCKEYNRHRDKAQDLERNAIKRMNKNWAQVRYRVGMVRRTCQDLLIETDEVKALKELKIVQGLLYERLSKKAEQLRAKAESEMKTVTKRGQEKEDAIKAKYAADGSECLKEHQSVVNHLSLIGVDCYTSMTVPTVCSNVSCRAPFDLTKLTASKRCAFPDCSSSKTSNCGCQMQRCSICSDSYCGLHYTAHTLWCSFNVDKKCGYHRDSGTLKPSGCHKRSQNQASLRNCQTCSVQCCRDCCVPCNGCTGMNYYDLDDDEYMSRYALCKQCQIVVGQQTLCHSCYSRKAIT